MFYLIAHNAAQHEHPNDNIDWDEVGLNGLEPAGDIVGHLNMNAIAADDDNDFDLDD